MNRALLPLILIIIAITAFFMWVNPHYANVKVLGADLAESNKALGQVAELESVRASLVDKENSFTEDNLTRLQKLLPDNVDNIRLFLDMQGVASRYASSIQEISVANQDQKTTTTQAIGPSNKEYGQMILSFSINISYENLSLFLKDLENSLRVVEIKSLAFTADDKNPNLYKVSIGINAFWLNSKPATASIISSQ
jgi:Tfp pilus assembly protein PilO